MSLFLHRLSVPAKFAAQFGGMLSVTGAAVAALAWSGTIRFEVARPELAVACLVASGGVAAALTWWMGRSASQPLKNALQVAEQASAKVGAAPFVAGKGDEGSRLLQHLTHMQERQAQLVRAGAALQAAKADQQDEMAAWAEDTLRLRAALDATGVDALITDDQGVILFVTRSLAKRLKAQHAAIKRCLPALETDRLVGQSWDAFAPVLQPLPSAAEGVWQRQRLQLQEQAFDLTLHPVRDRSGEQVGQVIVWRADETGEARDTQDSDVTSVAQDSMAIAASLFDALTVPAHVVGLDGTIVQANHAFRSLLQVHQGAFKAANAAFQSTDVEGASAGMLYADASTELSRLLALGGETRSRKVLGGRTYEVTETPISDMSGQTVAVLCQWLDCTDTWLAERSFSALAERVSAGDFTRPAALDGIQGTLREVGQRLNQVVTAMNDTSAPVREAVEQLGNALAQVAQSTLTVQEAIAAMPRRTDSEGVAKSNAMLADKAGVLLAQMVPTINQTTEVLQEPMSKQASEVLAQTADQLQEQAARLHAVVASYRLAVSNKTERQEEAQSALTACTA